MNKQEHLLTVLSEECAEVIHAICKANRFGIDDHGHNERPTNRVQLHAELNDLFAVANMLIDEEIIPPFDPKMLLDKQKRVLKYMDYAKETGALNNGE